MKEAIFVFLHGPEAYPEGAWEPILLDVLHEVGFTESSQLIFKSKLTLNDHVGGIEGVIGSGQFIQEPIRFGVHVFDQIVQERRMFNKQAVRWLDQISSRIVSCRSALVKRKEKSHEAALEDFRRLAETLNATGGLMDRPKQSEAFASDPKTVSEYEAIRQNPPDGFDEFETFLMQARIKLAELIEESRPIEPILLTEYGDMFVESALPGLYQKHLRDEMALQAGTHDVCGGNMTFRPTSKTNLTVMCSECPLNIRLARSTYSTFAQLRELGEKIRQR